MTANDFIQIGVFLVVLLLLLRPLGSYMTLVFADSPAAGQADLLTAVLHELGHTAGLEHAGGGLMDALLAAGVRHAQAPAHATGRCNPLSLGKAYGAPGGP